MSTTKHTGSDRHLPSTGAQLRDQGCADVLAADVAVHRNYGALVRAALDTLTASGQPFTAEDVRHAVTALDPHAAPHSPNVLPAIISRAATAGRIQAVGMVKATRRSRHGSHNRVWIGANNA